MAAGGASTDTKVGLARAFVAASPPGQVGIVQQNVKQIIDADAYTPEVEAAATRAFCIATNAVAASADGDRIVVCEEGRVDDTHFVSTRLGKVVEVDFATQAISAVGADSSAFKDEAVEPLRAAVAERVFKYADSRFQARGTKHGAAEVFGKDGKVVVVTSAIWTSLRNYSAGQWTARWTITPNEGGATVEGSAKIRTHFFEGGNVQMQTERRWEPEQVEGGADALAAAAVGRVTEAEDALQGSLRDMLASINDEALKELRRTLPVTREKMNWSVHQHRMRTTLQSKKA